MAFKRLVYHRSHFMIGVGVLGLAGAIAYAVSAPWDDPVNDGGAVGVIAALALLFLARGLTGEWGQRQLRVDVAAGKLKLPNGSIHALDELGALTLETKAMPTSRAIRTQTYEYRLRAANETRYYLYYSVIESETLLRKRALEEAILESRLRKVLERPSADGSAFRSSPDALAEIKAITPEVPRALAALEALAKDPDAHVRAQAQKLVMSLRAA